MKEKITRSVNGKWSETLVKNHKTGSFAAFNSKGQAAFGKGNSATLYSAKLENGKRENLGTSFLDGIIRALLN